MVWTADGEDGTPAGTLVRLRALVERLGCSRAEIIALAVLTAGALLGLGFLWSASRPQTSAPTLVAASSTAATATPGPAAREVVVHVAGRVRHPGVYELPAGARVADALQAAGGTLRSAQLAAVNLARPLVDGEQLLVPDTRSAADPPEPATGGRLSLNTATVGDLDELPGVGPVLAERILTYRDEIGGFQRVEQLDDVTGIGEQTMAELADLVTP